MALQANKSGGNAKPTKIGILDILNKHVRHVQRIYKESPAKWKRLADNCKDTDLNFNHALHRELCDKGSEDFRNVGNQFFKAGHYRQSLLCYTQSVAAGVGGPLGSLAYSNRSAALYHMKLYKECLKDIDRSLVLGYPNDHLRYNLLIRKAKCLQFLKKDYSDALEEALQAIDDYNKVGGEELKKRVRSKMDDPEPIYKNSMPTSNKWKLPDLCHGPSEEVPSFSSAISIAHSKELGRHLIANRDLDTGDVLIAEESIVSAISPEVHWDFCSFCFKFCLSMIPCKLCGVTMYCSVLCRDSDWNTSHEGACHYTRHNYMDPHYKVLDLNDTHIPPSESSSNLFNCILQRLIQFIGVQRIRDAVKKNEPMQSWSANDPRTRGFRDGKFTTVDLEALISLEDNFGKIDATMMEKYAGLAISLSGLHAIPPSELMAVTAVYLKLILVYTFNHKSVHAFKAHYGRIGIPRIELGNVMYLASSLINHSCDPTMYQVSYGSHIVYRARRPIKKGEQLTDCYAASFSRSPYRERQRTCLETYKFNCKCEPCAKGWPILQHMPDLSLLNTSSLIKKAHENGLDVTDKDLMERFLYFCWYGIPADNEMKPKMAALLRSLHSSDMRINQWYFQLQECIKNYYRAQGSCFFFEDAKEILKGSKKFDVTDAVDNLGEKLKRCVEIPGPHGTKGFA